MHHAPTATRNAAAPLYSLPSLLTPFIDREAERALLAERLADPLCRLITITGAGGSGKSRLAIEAAHALNASGSAMRFTHGIIFVSLVGLTPAETANDTIAIAVAADLGLLFDGPEAPFIQLQRALRDRILLLILDNVEHLRGVATFITALLLAAPQIVVIATSREPLGLQGEWLITLDGLAVPSSDGASEAAECYPAVILFAETARRVAPDFSLDATTLPAVIRICRLIDGLPLGIELAANWLRVLSCTEVASEIAENLDFLNSESQHLAERQRSLRAVFDYSWELLTPAEQQALRRLAIFSGNFTREAAAAVAGAPLPRMASLINKSLVRRVGATQPAEQPMRYALPQTLRQYAAEELTRIGELEEVAARHATYYLNLVAAHIADLRGTRQSAALDIIAADLDAIRAAWRWALEHHDHAAIGRSAMGLFHFFDMRSRFQEGAANFAAARQALEPHRTEPEVQPVWAMVLAQQAWFIFHFGRQQAARKLLEESVAALRSLNEPQTLVFALNYLAAVCSYLGEYAVTEQLCAESLLITTSSGNEYGCAVGSNILGQAAYDRGDYAVAKHWHEQSMVIGERLGDRWGQAFSLINLGKVAFRLAHHNEARALFEQSLHIRAQIGDRRGMAICNQRLGDVAVAMGEMGEAAERYSQSLAISEAIGNQWGITHALIHLAHLAADRQQDSAAASLLTTALSQALETSALPQLQLIFNTAIPLLQRATAHELSRTLQSMIATAPTDIGVYHHPAQQLREWLSVMRTELSLERAIGMASTTPAPHPATELQPPLVLPGGLTQREVEVLRLVAHGLTDAQVAEQLIISRRTVSTHLTAIYSKLQVTSRSAATRFAIEHGLLRAAHGDDK